MNMDAFDMICCLCDAFNHDIISKCHQWWTNPRGRGKRLMHITIVLSILLGVTWCISLVFIIKLQQLDFRMHHNIVVNEVKEVDNDNYHENEINDHSSSKDVHIVFSTDCSGYQHWQSIASYYSLRRAGHLGPITRIVSGCSKPSQEEDIQAEFEKIQKHNSNQLRLHFTPLFALGGHYKYSNKPGGFYHWMNHTTIHEPVVALVDPDMMALRPITPQLGKGMTPMPVTLDGYHDLVQYKDEHGKILLLRQQKLPPLPSHVTRGVAAGQHFGLGGFWASAGMKNAKPAFKTFNLTAVCGANSPCLNAPQPYNGAYTTPELADKNYAVGPVYIASTADWKGLLPRWHEFMPRVHAQYPKLLAEMYAFTMAAADMQLKFALSSSYMVSDPGTMSSTESWVWIDEYFTGVGSHDSHEMMRSVCKGATSNTLPTETMIRLESYGYGNYHNSNTGISMKEGLSSGGLPSFLHHCQNYKLANHVFAKRKMSHDFFKCDGLPLKLDVDAIVNELDSIENDSSLSLLQKKKQARTGYMLCHLIPMMNLALDDYKSDVCQGEKA